MQEETSRELAATGYQDWWTLHIESSEKGDTFSFYSAGSPTV